ncbi:protein disulfide-isomerase A1 [Schistosoma bovis]|uniref:Protein disulfide-isomerase n=1 Tax=Schistosoma bovis TaxID=6184 RepID=A0A430Q3L5_SCHBO|nr:protein disulfide-isomerase A1 [Schistosoma bovis]
MKLSVALVVVSLVLAASEVTEEDDVLVLNKKNFDDVIKNNKFVLVEFYAPWCGHCKALAPEYSAAAKKLKDKGSLVKLAKVDATVEEELAFKHGVKGYPTLKFFRNEQPIDFGGERDSDAIVNWCLRKSKPPVEYIESLDSCKQFIDKATIAILGFIKDTDSLDLADFEKVADELDDADFAIANSSDILTEYGITQTPKIVLFKNFDDNRVEYTGETLENLKHFVQVESVPLVSEFSQKTAGIVFGSPIQKHIVFFLSKSTDHSDLVGKLTEVARQFKGKLHVIYVDVDVENNLRVLEFFGLSKNDAPTYRIIELGEETTKYKPDTNDYSVSAMSDFVQRTIDGKVKPFLMSEEIPSHQTGAVKVLVGKNYNDVVKDKSKDVFVKLYAPWCGHCKALAPVWDELGETFKNSDTVIAKMDATVNEVEDLKVTSFPTLKFYPKNSDEVIDYTGDRSFEALKKFVESGGKSSEATKQEDQIKDEL